MVKRLAWIFGIAGALIFAGLTAVLVSGESHIRVPAIAALVTFCSVVIAYLGGIEGGLALRETAGDERSRAVTFFFSALPTLAAWGVLWLDSTQHQLEAAIAIFVIVWACDLWLARHGLVASWFLDMRTAATALACAILGVALWLL
ncbi:MAG TPA: DUF3429 domain-containing protein [Usitatibacter sp.]|jgi:hypothetical protein|nr:DUF3429 domain-containing protein [Usitatibacter sp.]